MRRLLAIITIAFTLAGCGTIAGIDATTVLGTTMFRNAVSDNNGVTVADFRKQGVGDVNKTVVTDTKPNTVAEDTNWKPEGHNWNNTNNTTNEKTVVTDQPNVIAQAQEVQEVQYSQEDRASTLTWFFFAMMLMGMLGAGIIGLIEAVSGRNSLDTTPSAPPPQYKKPNPNRNNNNQQNKKGK